MHPHSVCSRCVQVRVWDIRRSGCIHTLDQYCTSSPMAARQEQRRQRQQRQQQQEAATASAEASGSRERRKRSTRQRPGTDDAAALAAAADALSSGLGGCTSSMTTTVASGGVRVGCSRRMWPGSSPSGGGLTDSAVRAHNGPITCLLPTPDGLHWLSGGADSRLRLWDASSWHNRLVHYQVGRFQLTNYSATAIYLSNYR